MSYNFKAFDEAGGGFLSDMLKAVADSDIDFISDIVFELTNYRILNTSLVRQLVFAGINAGLSVAVSLVMWQDYLHMCQLSFW